MKHPIESEVATFVSFTSSFRDWHKTVEDWRYAFFVLLSERNSNAGIEELTIYASYDHQPYLYMMVDPVKINVSALHELLENLGYENIKSHTFKARVYESIDLEHENDYEQDITEILVR